jgi:hypothetical protein
MTEERRGPTPEMERRVVDLLAAIANLRIGDLEVVARRNIKFSEDWLTQWRQLMPDMPSFEKPESLYEFFERVLMLIEHRAEETTTFKPKPCRGCGKPTWGLMRWLPEDDTDDLWICQDCYSKRADLDQFRREGGKP